MAKGEGARAPLRGSRPEMRDSLERMRPLRPKAMSVASLEEFTARNAEFARADVPFVTKSEGETPLEEFA